MKNTAIIYCPTKSAMQSGRAHEGMWLLEFCNSHQQTEPLMGWCSSEDTQKQVKLKFGSLEKAEKYAKDHQLDYIVQQPKLRKISPKSYASNFANDRKIPWTH